MTREPAEIVVEFRDVSFAFSSRPVVDRVSLALGRGESVALVGRSGAGKSTLLRLANGLLMPSHGTVLVDGKATTAWNPIRLRRRTGYVLQGIGLFPHFTVEQNVALVPRLEGWGEGRRRERARELLALVGLPPAE
jgi:osmoprotectant transport system ATP-binding protein